MMFFVAVLSVNTGCNKGKPEKPKPNPLLVNLLHGLYIFNV